MVGRLVARVASTRAVVGESGLVPVGCRRIHVRIAALVHVEENGLVVDGAGIEVLGHRDHDAVAGGDGHCLLATGRRDRASDDGGRRAGVLVLVEVGVALGAGAELQGLRGGQVLPGDTPERKLLGVTDHLDAIPRIGLEATVRVVAATGERRFEEHSASVDEERARDVMAEERPLPDLDRCVADAAGLDVLAEVKAQTRVQGGVIDRVLEEAEQHELPAGPFRAGPSDTAGRKQRGHRQQRDRPHSESLPDHASISSRTLSSYVLVAHATVRRGPAG
jgi:hypothetical protein